MAEGDGNTRGSREAAVRPGDFTPWRVLSRRDVFTVPGRIAIAVETVELPDGRRVDDYWQIAVPDFVVVVAETADDRIVCVRQYRHGPRRTSLELIAGRIEPGDDPLATARRELLEESGYASDAWEVLGSFTVSATQGVCQAHVFRAAGAVKQQEPRSGDLEDSVVELLTRARLKRAVCGGEVVTGAHLAACSLALLRRRGGRR